MGELETLRDFIESLDEDHRAYAQAYADEIAVGDPKPSAAGLDRPTVREIRRRIWVEWRRRMQAMPGSRPR
jgi:hypothetical protein